MAKATHGIRVTRKTDTMSMKFELMNKATEKVEDSWEFTWEDVHPDTRDFCSLYGVTKILMDRCSDKDMLDKVREYRLLFEETLSVGLTEKERAKPGKRLTALESEALMKHYKQSLTVIQSSFAELSEEKKAEVLASKEVKKLIAEISKEQAEAKVSFEEFITTG